MKTATQTQPTALNAFMLKKVAIDDLLAKIQQISDDHFNVAPDDVNWGHVGSLDEIQKKLTAALNWAK